VAPEMAPVVIPPVDPVPPQPPPAAKKPKGKAGPTFEM